MTTITFDMTAELVESMAKLSEETGLPSNALVLRTLVAQRDEARQSLKDSLKDRAGWKEQWAITSGKLRLAEELIQKLRNTGGDPIDVIWARWRGLFREYDDKLSQEK